MSQIKILNVKYVFKPYTHTSCFDLFTTVGLHRTQITYNLTGKVGGEGLPSLMGLVNLDKYKIIKRKGSISLLECLGKVQLSNEELFKIIDYLEWQASKKALEESEWKSHFVGEQR